MKLRRHSLRRKACRVDTSPSHWVTHRMEVRNNPLPRAPRHFELRMRGGWVRWASSFGGSHRRRVSLILDWNSVWALQDYDTEGVTWDCNTAPSATDVFCVIWDKIIILSAIWEQTVVSQSETGVQRGLDCQHKIYYLFFWQNTLLSSPVPPCPLQTFLLLCFFSGYCARHL